MKTIVHFIVVIFIFLFLLNDHQHHGELVYAQTLPTNELLSAIFLIQTFGSPIGQTEAAICGSGQFICNVDSSGVRHIEQISLLVSTFTSVGSPNSSQVLEFPQLNLLILNSPTSQSGINILDYVKNLPKLTRFEVRKVDTITQIPDEFPIGLTSLQTFALYDITNLTSIPYTFFNGSSVETINFVGTKINSIPLNLDAYQPILPSLKTLAIGVTVENSFSMEFTRLMFPSLKTVNFSAPLGLGNGTIDLYFRDGINTVQTIASTGQIIPHFSKPDQTLSLILKGPYNYIFEPTNNMLSYISLGELVIKNTNLPDLPLQSVPFYMRNLDLSNNLLKGPFPAAFLSQYNNNPKLVINIANNTEFLGSLPQEFCYISELHIENTTIQSVPLCWWCYRSNSPQFTNTLTPPPASVDVCSGMRYNANINSTGGIFYIEGDNLGWGDASQNLSVEKPNTQIKGTYNPATDGIHVTKTYQFGATGSVTLNITEWRFAVTDYQFGDQNAYSIEFIVYFYYFNPDNLPWLTLNDSLCDTTRFDMTTKTIVYTFRSLPTIPKPSYSARITDDLASFSTNVYFDRKTSLTAVSLDPPSYPPTYLILNGFFGYPVPIDGSVLLKNNNDSTLPDYTCNVDTAVSNATMIKCRFISTNLPPPGPTTIVLNVSSGYYISPSMLSLPSPLPSNDDCEERTNNCNSHGSCVNGTCVCDKGWFDDCKFQSNPDPNIIFTPNQTDPTPTFTYKDFVFSFSMVAIQELDADDSIITSIPTNNWNVSDQSTTDLSSYAYRLTTHLLNTTYAPDYLSLNVTSTIDFSNQSRTILFGGDQIQLASGSIKIGVNVTNWPFKSLTSHLRIIFETNVNNEQTFVGCDDEITTIESFQNFVDGDSIQYLRVTKDDVQFFGRFLDYSVSDGRKTYSRTQTLNITQINDQQSTATIGINLPQCQECLIDPDFSALLLKDHCPSEDDSKRWKIIVGVVVGVVGALCVAIVVVSIVKRNRFYFILKNRTLGGSKGGNSRTVRLNSMRG